LWEEYELQVLENKVLREISGPMMDEVSNSDLYFA
jgi:hypothetical protein